MGKARTGKVLISCTGQNLLSDPMHPHIDFCGSGGCGARWQMIHRNVVELKLNSRTRCHRINTIIPSHYKFIRECLRLQGQRLLC